jgi:hypothetical protein
LAPKGGTKTTPLKGTPVKSKPFNPLTSSYGLNLKSKAPFNALAPSPTTQGAFNQQLLNLAQPQYLPQLQDIAGQQGAETSANKMRTSDIGSIYNQYQQQAQSAYNEVQKSLQDIIAQNNPGQGQANLSAALQSAQGGENQLSQMMGLTAPPGPGTLPYTGAAQAAQTATQQELNGLASSFLGVPAEQLGNAPLERATELNTESLRHQAAAQGLRTQQSALVEQIPGIIATARNQLIATLQSGQSLQFQEGLAGKQFGLQKQAQGFNESQTKKSFHETQLNDAANRSSQLATITQNAQALRNQTNNTATATNQAIAKAQGQAQANAIKWLQSWLVPSKAEMATKTVKDPNTGATTHVNVLKNPKGWHRDVGSALRSIMKLYGLGENEALSLMEAVGGSTFVSGQGGMTIANWAGSFRQRAAAQNRARSLANKFSSGKNRLTSGAAAGLPSTLSRTPPIKLPR